MATGGDAPKHLRLLGGGEKSPPRCPGVIRERPVVGVGVGGKEDHLRAPAHKPSFDGHLHLIPLEEIEQVAEWQITAEVVEERSSVMVVAIVPNSSGTDGLHPQAKRKSRALSPDPAAFADSSTSIDDVALSGAIFRRDIVRRSGNALEEPDSGGVSKELDGIFSDEHSEWLSCKDSRTQFFESPSSLDSLGAVRSRDSLPLSLSTRWSFSNLRTVAVSAVFFAAVSPGSKRDLGNFPVRSASVAHIEQGVELSEAKPVLSLDIDLEVVFPSCSDFVLPSCSNDARESFAGGFPRTIRGSEGSA